MTGVGDGALQLGIDFACGQGLGPGGKVEINRRKLGKAHAERAENSVGVLHHPARARADRDAPSAQVGKRSDRRFRPHDEEQRACIHRRDHGKIDRMGERRLAVLCAPDPVRGHEAELDLVRLQSIGVFGAGGLRLQELDRSELRFPLEDGLEGAALAVEGAVAFGGADPDCHRRQPARFAEEAIAARSTRRNSSIGAPRRSCEFELAEEREVASKVAAVGGDAPRQMGARAADQSSVVSVPIENFFTQCIGHIRLRGARRCDVHRCVKEVAERPAQITSQDEESLVELLSRSDDEISIEIAGSRLEISLGHHGKVLRGGILACGNRIERRATADDPGHRIVEPDVVVPSGMVLFQYLEAANQFIRVVVGGHDAVHGVAQ